MTAGTSERLRLLYDLSRRLATFSELDDVLRHATSGLRRLFDAEGAAVLIHDPSSGELRFPIASQREGSEAEERELAEIRFPADQGIAGWVLAKGEAVAVPDVANDPRFYRGVDKATGATTQTLLAAPLRTEGPSIGVVEVMNPAAGQIAGEDLEFLDAVASDIAVAYAKAELHARMREEAATLRRLTRVVGVSLVVAGVLVTGWTVFATLARALPLTSALTSPALVAGVLAVAGGVAVVTAARR